MVIDTDVFSADLVRTSRLAERYAPLVAGRPALISFQTAAELRYGALQRSWVAHGWPGSKRRSSKLRSFTPAPDLITVYAQLRVACRAAGHALAQREHNADRWIAATAVRLGIPLISNDGIFREVPGLALETLSET